ncbi:lytic transglycosylase, partial [Nocardia sp. NPDC057353]
RSGGAPAAGRVSPEAIVPGSGGWGTAPGVLAASAPVPAPLLPAAPEGLPLEQAVQTPTPAAVPEPMITIPGLPPIPCGIFCPPPPPPPVEPGEPGPRAEALPGQAPVPAPAPQQAAPQGMPLETQPEPAQPESAPLEFGPDGQPVAPAPDPATPPPPGLVLPFGITIPLPPPPAPAP